MLGFGTTMQISGYTLNIFYAQLIVNKTLKHHFLIIFCKYFLLHILPQGNVHLDMTFLQY